MVVVVALVWKNRDGSVGLGGGGGMDGKDLCTTARATPLSIPVWYVCSRGEDKDKMSGLRWKVIAQKTLPADTYHDGRLGGMLVVVVVPLCCAIRMASFRRQNSDPTDKQDTLQRRQRSRSLHTSIHLLHHHCLTKACPSYQGNTPFHTTMQA